ncbi:MAG: hypothetical protein HC863_01685, partial [Myxococcales bacterium]|nr:hypothetical protein [Myxococcales bacterium]
TLTQTSTYSGRFTWTIHDEVIRLRQWATDTVYELPKVSEDRSRAIASPAPTRARAPSGTTTAAAPALPGQYELARRPSSPNSAPGLRARVVGDAFTGFEPLAAAAGTEIPHTLSAKEVVTHLRDSSGFGQYLEMLETQGLASAAVVDGVIQHKLNLLGMSGKRVTTEALRGDVRDHFRERVRAHLCDPSLSETASWQRFRDMAANLSPSERGYLAEVWVRGRHLPGSEGQRRVDVLRTSGVDAGKVQRRVVDAVEGDTAVEIKDILGLIDRDQFEAYLDMLESTDGDKPLFQKVKYVFTNPEGAIANLEFMAGQMRKIHVDKKLVVECFDSRGVKHVTDSYEGAMRLLTTLRGKP